jgi:lactate dehydrogenase-like 2-hydroxyacid dehydrogenase
MKNGLIVLGSFALGSIMGGLFVRKKSCTKVNDGKYWYYYETLNKWLELKNNGHSLAEFFEKNNYKNIAIYGMGHIGKRLYEELENTTINVKYAIDGGIGLDSGDITIYSPEDVLETVDVIVVTALHAYNSIEETMKQKTNIPIISLEYVVNN